MSYDAEMFVKEAIEKAIKDNPNYDFLDFKGAVVITRGTVEMKDEEHFCEW